MKFLAIDFGERRTGIAVGLSDFKIPFPRPAIDLQKEDLIVALKRLIKEEGVDALVLGYPLHKDGSMSTKAQLILNLKPQLESQLNVPIHLQDETYTTVKAKERTSHFSMKDKRNKGKLDSAAACIILEEFFSTMSE
jgi:putative holliday junction resolvase